MVATSSTCSLMNHCMNWSEAKSLSSRAIFVSSVIWAVTRRSCSRASSTGATTLSNATIGAATFTVDYGRPLARGRTLLGDVIPYDRVWRTGANAATQLTTSAPITLAGMQVPAGKYTLWTLPHADGRVELIVNRQTGQWGTGYGPAHDLGRAPMKAE